MGGTSRQQVKCSNEEQSVSLDGTKQSLQKLKPLLSVADLREVPVGPAPPPLILGKKEKMTEGKKSGSASKTTPPPSPLSSRSGSTTGYNYRVVPENIHTSPM